MENERHFQDGPFTSQRKRLPSVQYAMVIDNGIRSTADALLTKRGKVLIGKRRRHPCPTDWVIGGGRDPGESFRESIARNVKRELRIEISPERFHMVNRTYSLVWPTRAHPPQDHGCHDDSHLFWAEISAEEAARIRHNEEYSEIKWISPRKIAADDQYKPALRQMCRDLIEARKGPIGKTIKIWKDWGKEVLVNLKKHL